MGCVRRAWHTKSHVRCAPSAAPLPPLLQHTPAATMQQPQSIERVQNSVERMMEDIGRQHLIPSQKAAFLCCAKCCDDTGNFKPQQLQSWWVAVWPGGAAAVRPFMRARLPVRPARMQTSHQHCLCMMHVAA